MVFMNGSSQNGKVRKRETEKTDKKKYPNILHTEEFDVSKSIGSVCDKNEIPKHVRMLAAWQKEDMAKLFD